MALGNFVTRSSTNHFDTGTVCSKVYDCILLSRSDGADSVVVVVSLLDRYGVEARPEIVAQMRICAKPH